MRTEGVLENLKGRGRLEDLCQEEKIILKGIVSKLGWRMWTDLIWFGM
jgi:hypothetical protein